MTDNKDIIPDFLDGNLSEDEEKAVFYQLSQDEELLAEYKKLKTIFAAIDKSKANFEPSQEQTDKLFATLGIGAGEKKKRAFPFFLHKPAIKYIATAAASVLLFLSVSKFDSSKIFNSANKYQTDSFHTKQFNNKVLSNNSKRNTEADKESSNSSNANEVNIEYTTTPNINNATKRLRKIKDENIADNAMLISANTPFSYSQDLYDEDNQSNSNYIAENESLEESNNHTQYGDNHTQDDFQNSENSEDLCMPQENIAMYEQAEKNTNYDYQSDVFRSVPLNLSQDFYSNNSRRLYNNYNMMSYSAPKDKLYLEIKNHIYFSKVKEEVITNYTNLGISLYYNFIDNLSLGLDVRDESFSKYSNMNLMPSIKHYSDNNENPSRDSKPALFSIENVATTTVSMNAKYDLITKYREFTPSASLSFGVNSAGTVGRASLACSFNTILNFTASIGGEYSILSYQYMGLSTTSSKLGVSFGISYNF